MSGNSTVYDVKVRYALEDKASNGAKGIASACDKAAGSAFSLKGALMAVGGMAALSKAKSALIDFNSEIDQMKIGLSTVMQMQLHMPFAKANKEADKLFNTFQEMAKKSPATTKDFMEMANSIAPAVAMMGGGPEKLAKLSQGGVIAGLALGERADVTALDIKQMLMGTVSVKDRLAQQLLASKGLNHLEFNDKSGGERAKLVEEMLSQDALKTAADQFGNSFKGQISTLQDTLQIALGDVGKPLMASITDEVKKMNSWIERHPKTIAEIGKNLGSMIKNTFEFVKSAATWLIENKDTLLTIGKIFLVFKGAQLAQGAIKGFIGGLKGISDAMIAAKNGMSGALMGGGGLISTVGKLGSGLLGVLPAVAAFTAALFEAADWVSDHMPNQLHDDKSKIQTLKDAGNALYEAEEITKRIKAIDETAVMTDELKTERANLMAKFNDPSFMGPMLKELDKISGGKYSRMSPTQFLARGVGVDSQFSITDGNRGAAAQVLGKSFGVDEVSSQAGIKMLAEVSETLEMMQMAMGVYEREDIFREAFKEKFGPPKAVPDPSGDWKAGKTSDINVTIQKIEVASEDPDRFVFGIAKLSENAAKHPTASQHTVVGGF